MGRFIQSAKVEIVTTIALTDDELGALDALTGYGVDPFLKVFYEHMGRHYMEPHEKGIRSLFETIRKEVPHLLHRAKSAREVFVDKPEPAGRVNPPEPLEFGGQTRGSYSHPQAPAAIVPPDSGMRTKGG